MSGVDGVTRILKNLQFRIISMPNSRILLSDKLKVSKIPIQMKNHNRQFVQRKIPVVQRRLFSSLWPNHSEAKESCDLAADSSRYLCENPFMKEVDKDDRLAGAFYIALVLLFLVMNISNHIAWIDSYWLYIFLLFYLFYLTHTHIPSTWRNDCLLVYHNDQALIWLIVMT